MILIVFCMHLRHLWFLNHLMRPFSTLLINFESFRVDSQSGVLSLMGAGLGSYAMDVKVKDKAGTKTVTSRVSINVRRIVPASLKQFASMRLSGVRPAQLVDRPALTDATGSLSLGSSFLDKLGVFSWLSILFASYWLLLILSFTFIIPFLFSGLSVPLLEQPYTFYIFLGKTGLVA